MHFWSWDSWIPEWKSMCLLVNSPSSASFEVAVLQTPSFFCILIFSFLHTYLFFRKAIAHLQTQWPTFIFISPSWGVQCIFFRKMSQEDTNVEHSWSGFWCFSDFFFWGYYLRFKSLGSWLLVCLILNCSGSPRNSHLMILTCRCTPVVESLADSRQGALYFYFQKKIGPFLFCVTCEPKRGRILAKLLQWSGSTWL